MRSGNVHYAEEFVGGSLGLNGAGILAWITADQLHPPMLNDESIWRDGAKWELGARRYVIELAQLAYIRAGDRVLDIGCGVCGPARLLVDGFDAVVTAITNSSVHAKTSEMLNERNPKHASRIDVQYVRGVEDWPARQFDVAWSVNMLYQVSCHQEIYARVSDLLSPGGRFVIDDWMATDLISESDLQLFEHYFHYRDLLNISRVEAELIAAGFHPALCVVDRGQVGRELMTRYFDTVMQNYFLPKIAARWPDSKSSEISGRQMAQDFTEAVNHTLKLYSEGKLTYRTLVAIKR